MLNEDEVAALECLIRRMTDKQRSGLEAWISGGYPFPFLAGKQWVPDGPLWEAVKEAQECMHWYEVPPTDDKSDLVKAREELVAQGLLQDSGRRRNGQIVWELT